MKELKNASDENRTLSKFGEKINSMKNDESHEIPLLKSLKNNNKIKLK